MKKLVYLVLLVGLSTYSQKIITNNKLIINHGDITLYLTKDTCTMVSKHVLTQSNFKMLDSERDNRWFQDTYKGKYSKEPYVSSGYDLGHLTPSHITSYDNQLNHWSFSLFNQAPQIASFNRGKWKQLEQQIEKLVYCNNTDVVIVTGVIYELNNRSFLPKSRIPIPMSFFKVLFLPNRNMCWIGSNRNGSVIPITLKDLNKILKDNKNDLEINP